MNPQESAQHLIEKFYNVEDTEWTIDNGCGITWNEAKQCAIIAVDEIYKELTQLISPSIHGFRHQYWKEVRNEIEKL